MKRGVLVLVKRQVLRLNVHRYSGYIAPALIAILQGFSRNVPVTSFAVGSLA